MSKNIIFTAHSIRVEIRYPRPLTDPAKEIARRINKAIPEAVLMNIDTRHATDDGNDNVTLEYRRDNIDTWSIADMVKAIDTNITPVLYGLDYSIYERESKTRCTGDGVTLDISIKDTNITDRY